MKNIFIILCLISVSATAQRPATKKLTVTSTQVVTGMVVVDEAAFNKFLDSVDDAFAAQNKAAAKSIDSVKKVTIKQMDSVVKASARLVKQVTDSMSKLLNASVTPVKERLLPDSSNALVYHLSFAPVSDVEVYVSDDGQRYELLSDDGYKATRTGRLELVSSTAFVLVKYYK